MDRRPSHAPRPPAAPQGQTQPWDAVETYFECITECSLDDGACVTRCVEDLRQGDEVKTQTEYM